MLAALTCALLALPAEARAEPEAAREGAREALPTAVPESRTAQAGPCLNVELFARAGCPHCAAAERYLARLGDAYPATRIIHHDVALDGAALERLREIARGLELGAVSVPTIVVCDDVLVGFDEDVTPARLEALLGTPDATVDAKADHHLDRVDLGPLGSVSVSELGLPLFTIAIGLVDGFNPCAMWVLLLLLSILVGLDDRKRMLLVAGTFVAVSGLAYLAFMAAWLEVFLLVGLSRAVQVGLGLVAVTIGVVHVKDFFAFRRGLTLSIPARAKPGIYRRIRGIVRAETPAAAVAGAALLAVLVNAVELLCTAGLPALYTQILSRYDLSRAGRYGYLLLYDAAYVADDALMVGLVVVTLSRARLDERAGRWLKLASGVVVLGLGLLLLVAPDALTP